MKVLITNYTFNAATKKITFSDYLSGGISLESVLLIVNVTDGLIIYNFPDPAKGGTVSSNELTLDYDTTGMSNTDDLMIYYDDPDAAQKVELSSAIAGEDLENNVLVGETRALYYNKTATGAIINGAGRFYGFMVNSHTSGTVKLWDALSATGSVILNTITFPSGPYFVVLPFAVPFSVGLYATFGGTADITFFAVPNA